MAEDATLNIRLADDLKTQGVKVLARNNMSVSEFVRRSFEQLVSEQCLPEALTQDEDEQQEANEKRRRVLRSWAGTIPSGEGVDLATLKLERIESKSRPGVRT